MKSRLITLIISTHKPNWFLQILISTFDYVKFSNYIISILFLCIFLFQMLSKPIIVISYYLNKDYVANELCENKSKPQMHCEGKCYLKKQLDKAKDTESSDLGDKLKKHEIQLFVYSTFTLNFEMYSTTAEATNLYSPLLPDLSSISVFRPPQA